MAVIFWLLVFAIMVIGEIITLQLISIWFAVGALGALAAALLHTGLEIQICIFLAVSFLLLLAVKPAANKLMKRSITRTNVDSLIGQTAKVTAMIDNQNGFGTAVVKGQEWTAVSADDDVVIQPGKLVIIKKVSGVKLVVEEKQ